MNDDDDKPYLPDLDMKSLQPVSDKVQQALETRPDGPSPAQRKKPNKPSDINNPGLENSMSGWWQFMKEKSGGKGGAITRMALDVLRDIGSRGSKGIAAATGGKYGNANPDISDLYGLQGYDNLWDNYYKQHQGINETTAKTKISEIVNDNASIRESNRQMAEQEHQTSERLGAETNARMAQTSAQNFQSSENKLDRENTTETLKRQIEATAEQNLLDRENATKLLELGTELNTQQQKTLWHIMASFSNQEMDVISNFNRALSGISDKREIAELVQIYANSAKGISEEVRNWLSKFFSTGGFTGKGGKYESAGIVHKGEYVIPKEGVDQSSELPKPAYMKKLMQIKKWSGR